MEAAMDDSQASAAESQAPPPPSSPPIQEEDSGDDDSLQSKVQKLMEKITSSPDNPNPSVLHALSSILETQESRYMEETGHSSLNNGRATHIIGRLGSLVRDNDDFFELISSKFLSESRYSISVQAAAARLLLICSLTLVYPHVFEETVVLENIKNWVMDENARFSGEDRSWKNDSGRKEASDSEMLRTYSTGLLALCLAGGGQVVEDVLTSGLSAKLMRYLRTRVLGETNTSQKDGSHIAESKNTPGATCMRGRDEGRSRLRLVLETNHLDDPRIIDEGSLHDQSVERDHDRSIGWQTHGEELKGKGRVNEGAIENEHALTSPGSGSRLGQGRSIRDRSLSRNLDTKRAPDAKKCFGRTIADGFPMEREDNDDRFQECKVGSKDISDLVKKAVKSAEAEAKEANAPLEAIKAAGDAAAEVVKSAALEEFKTTNDEEAAILAASKAASTVIDAANAIEVSRSSSNMNADPMNSRGTETEINEEVEEFFIMDADSLAQLREKYCIQCLEILGEYVEVLGPVLHEKGVDVCLALLQRSSKLKEASKLAMLLPDVLKLICALAAHRKFAAVFVDRGGMQKLLAVPRVALTFFGLSSCLFTIGSLQGIMERVCALPSEVVHQVVELALQLLECSQDQARKNAALFFAAAFVFRAVLDSFDAQDGLQKLLSLLHDAASVRSGVNSGGLGLSNSGSLRNDRSPPEVLTSSEKQIAYHTCVALRQYFRAHLLLLVDSIRPNKNNRSAARNLPSVRAAYKPLDLSNEAMDAVFLQLQKDRKLGPAFVRARWLAVDKFLTSNGHITMLELCQAPPVERYLHDLLQYALGVLHIVTLVPYSRKLIVNVTLSNNRVGIAVILDAANGASFVDPEIIQPALNVLVNLVCPPPSISLKPPVLAQGQQSASVQTSNDRGSSAVLRLVGDRRISLGAGAGCAGLAAQLEQGYRQAREAVRANSGIKVLLHLLQPRIVSPPATLDCLRALACRVLLGLARDDAIAHILTKLQVGKKLSELIRDSGSQTSGNEQGRWQAELAQVAIELIGIVTNSGRASTLAATDAATPTLRRIERAAIAAATPITYHSRELLLLIHEHLQASGLSTTAAQLLKEAQLTPLPSLAAPSSLVHQASSQETPSMQLQWPSGRIAGGFLSNKLKPTTKDEDSCLNSDSSVSSSKKKPLVFSSTLSFQFRNQPQSHDAQSPAISKVFSTSKKSSAPASVPETPSVTTSKPNLDAESQYKTPIILPMKRKLTELKDVGLASSVKRLNTSELGLHSPVYQYGRPTPSSVLTDNLDDNQCGIPHLGQMTPSSFQLGSLNDPHTGNTERLTLDSLVVQYLKHQHRQCPAPITTLPPLSLLHPHICPEPRRSLDAPSNVTARLSTREFRNVHGGIHGNRRDRQFIYSRFRPWRTCRDDGNGLLTSLAFLGDSAQIAAGSHSGELKFFDCNSSTMLESFTGHQYPLTLVQHPFDGCKAARFSNSGTIFAALSSESSRREILVPSDTMLLWNGVLWDRRGSGPVHRFDQFTDYGGGGFHPAGNEVIINSEVWDLRKFRLLRTVPSLDQTVITFNSRGDVIYAILRRNLEDIMSAVHSRRAKHPLFSAFRTVDAVNYSDIATITVDRCVLDFATEPTDSFVGLVSMDDHDEMFSSARMYEIGRRRPTDDDSDPDDAESEEDDEDEDEDADEDPLLGPALDGDGESDGDDLSNDDDSLGDFEEDDDDDDDGDFVMDDADFDGGGGILELVTEGDEDDNDSEVVESFSSGDEEDFGDNGFGF
ncbi:unnamed protein product, partial [Vitis vinifera]